VTLAGYGAADAPPAAVGSADPPVRTPAQRRNPDLECAWVKAC